MHPSSAYIFFYDIWMNEVPILYISTVKGKLERSRAGLQSIPGEPSTIAFSPDGLLVYAQEGPEILVYVFNPHSGELTAKTVISAPGVLSLLPWL
jgi:DNA-binding beta-propeller fold protein YncE